MKTQLFYRHFLPACIAVFFLFGVSAVASANKPTNVDNETFIEYKGTVIDSKTGNPLTFASITVSGTNISTISNTEGEFSLKISKDMESAQIIVSYIGYKNRTIKLSDLHLLKSRIGMEAVAVELPEVSVISKDAQALVFAMLEKKGENYFDTNTIMTAFYRETIRKNKTYVSLSEAVVEIYKQPYTSFRSDIVKLYKARKKADYTKLDTITFKLQGGPFNSLHLDIMKNPDFLFTEDIMTNYEFTFDRSTRMDNRLIYVIGFKQRPAITEPLYYGKLYIDAQNLTLKSAVFNLNVENRDEAARMFILKKPLNAKVYPFEAAYRMDYREKNGKWYYGYSRIELGIKVNWKKKLFNTNYLSTIEMAVTDWELNTENKTVSIRERLRPSVVIADEASGFSDPEFWGEFNVIEPEKSIESAIKKIQKQLERKNASVFN